MTAIGNTSAIEGRGTRAAVLGTVIGLVPAIVLGSLPFLLAEEPVVREQLAGNAVFALVYTSPYLLTLMASMERRPGVRGGLLTAFGILSLAACFSSMSLVSMALLPATFVIFFAAARSLAVSVRPLATTLLALLAGLLVAAAVGLSFFALFFGIEDPEARCWVLTTGTDGQPVWESRPNTGGAGSLGVGPLSGIERGVCVSDIISSSEAAIGMGFLATAFMGTLLISTRGRLLHCSRRVLLHFRRGGRPRGDGGVVPGTEAEGGEAGTSELARLRRLLGTGGGAMSSMG